MLDKGGLVNLQNKRVDFIGIGNARGVQSMQNLACETLIGDKSKDHNFDSQIIEARGQ